MRRMFELTIAIAVALVCTAASAQEVATESRDERLQRARSYVESARYYEASKIAEELLAAHGEDAEARAILDEATQGLRAVHQRQIEMARERAVRADAGHADQLALADAYFAAGEYAEAADAYARVPQRAWSQENRLRHARALAWTGRYDEAERSYRTLLSEGPTPALRLEYGRLLSWMGTTAASVLALQEAYDADPGEELAVALANAQAWSGNRTAAIELLTEFTARHPDAMQARRLLSEMQASPELRLELAGRMVDREPYNLALRVERARLLYDAGRYAGALREIDFIRRNADQQIEGLEALANDAKRRREEELARLDERRRLFESSQAADRQSMASSAGATEERLSLAKAYTGHAAYDPAIELYEEHLRLHPQDTDTRLQYARVLNWDERYPAAQKQYLMVLRERPERADLEYEYAQTLSHDADFVPAVRTFRSLTDLSSHPRGHLYPDVPAKAHFQLGQIYRWYGWNETAIEMQNRALSLNANHVEAQRELTRARMARPASAYGATYSYFEDSNDLRFQRTDLDGQHWITQRTALDGSIGRHQFERGSDDASATSLSGGVRHRFEDRLTGRVRAGANLYDGGIGTRPFWGAGVDWYPNLQTRTALDYNHYDLVYDVFTLASLGADSRANSPAAGDPLSIDDLRGRVDYQSGGFWSLLADGSYGRISDDNRRQALHGLLSFRVLRSPFVAVKADARYLSYDFRSNRYWSPESYRSLAAVLAVGGDIRDRFFWTVEGKAGKSYDRDRSSDIRTINARLTIPISDLLDVVGSYSYGKSGRFEGLTGGSGEDFVNYWQRRWYVGIRVRRLFADDDRRSPDRYYYDNRTLTGSPVIPPVGEVH